MTPPKQLAALTPTLWELPTTYKPGMRVPARLIATRELLDHMDAGVFEQIANVATLPGIVGHAYCMPDAHWGYGFPIGGVAAMDAREGVISPGGIGFDINCGMRLMRTGLTVREVQPRLEFLLDTLFREVPVGVGADGLLDPSMTDFKEILTEGAAWCVRKGYGWQEDLEKTEDHGCAEGANPEAVSSRALKRGLPQVGTLGSGNHYLEIQVVRKNNLYDETLAKAFGLFPDQVVVMFHCGSRGFGHQVASDSIEQFLQVMGPKYHLSIPDRELACCPFQSPEGQAYYGAMRCAMNMAYANRQMILHRIREVFARVFGKTAEELGLHQVFDVAHNTAKIETHPIDGQPREVVVHRKGATRAFSGQPVIIGGSMETGSYLLVGTPGSGEAFGSTAHGAGRSMSRAQAKRSFQGKALQEAMRSRGILVKAMSYSGLAEEAGAAYKDVDEVVCAAELAGLSKRVARLVPIGNIKG